MKIIHWLIENTSQMFIKINKYDKSLQKAFENMVEFYHKREEKITKFDENQFIKEFEILAKHYPLKQNFINALKSKNSDYVFDQARKFRKWTDSKPSKERYEFIEFYSKLSLYLDKIGQNQSIDEKILELKESIKDLSNQTIKNMDFYKHQIENAINRLIKWNSVIIIEASSVDQLEPSDIAHVYVGNDHMSPSFTLFNDNGKILVEDVLDGGDTDFFDNIDIQTDYFNLVNELKNPGSTSKGKTLTLYTARPKKDREQLLSSNKLPVNVFLADNFDHVDGLAHDLGNNEVRDIWKVRIDSRYLTQTLDGKVKYYQVTVDNAPLKSMELIS